MVHPMNIHPLFGKSKSKAQARVDTIVTPYREQSGMQSIPPSKHYMTLAGSWEGEGEPQHLSSVGLITIEQLVAAESDPQVYEANKKLGLGCTLHYGDLVSVMRSHLGVSIDPTIVNLDTMSGPKQAFRLLDETLVRLNELEAPQMLVWNVIAAKRWPRRQNLRDDFDLVSEHRGIALSLDRGGWQTVCSMEYGGVSTNQATTMRTYTLWRPE